MIGDCMCFLYQILKKSKLRVGVLGRIWELSDIDDDGFLICDEFILVHMCCASFKLAFWVCFIFEASCLILCMWWPDL